MQTDENIQIDPEDLARNQGTVKKASMAQKFAGSGKMALVGAAMIVGIGTIGLVAISYNRTQDVPTGAQVTRTPDEGVTPVGLEGTDQFLDLIDQRNVIAADEAERTGRTALPALISGLDPTDNRLDRLEQSILQMQQNQMSMMADMNQRMLEMQMERDRRAMTAVQPTEPSVDRIVIDGQLYATADSQNRQLDRMRQEINSIRQVQNGFLGGHGYATSVGGFFSEPMMGEGSEEAEVNRIISAGDLLFATLDVNVNSDVPGPVRATISQGRLRGSVVLGTMEVRGEYLVVSFNRITDRDGNSARIDAVAIDPNSGLVGLADRVDRRTLSRLSAVFGAAFLQGVGDSMRGFRTTTTIGDRTDVIEGGLQTAGEVSIAALGEVGRAMSQFIQPFANRPPTIIKYANTGIALLFIEPVNEEDFR